MQKYLCKIGIHRYVSLEMVDCFTTAYVDTTWGPIKHIVWYQQCSCCGKRRVKDTYKKDTLGGTRHAGIEYARVGWVTYGRAYIGNGESRTLLPTAPKPTKKKLRVIDGGKNG
jgi:hypothetical protein